ncbi:DUF4158 domain-containing protein [Streptosporangium soli]|nr:DUF4158 domain-containing protein [Streptosporangium sp. KLBMP 9127]
MFTAEQLEQLQSFPEISREELIKHFTLTSADQAFVDPGRGRGRGDKLGLAVQLGTLSWLGFVPDDVASVPPAAVARLAEQLRPARCGPISWTSRATASPSSRTSTASRTASVRPPSGDRLVTIVGHEVSRGRTWPSFEALSSSRSSRRLAV